MKIIKSLLKCFFFFLMGAFTCVVLGITAISYYSVEQLAKAISPESTSSAIAADMKKTNSHSLKPEVSENNDTPVNPNLKELSLISLNYVDELNLFDNLIQEISKKTIPEMCSTLCNPMVIDKEKLREERSSYLANYYKQQGLKALEDPLFRLRLMETSFISNLFPLALRSFLNQVQNKVQNGQVKTFDKLILALQLQATVTKELASLYFQRNELIQTKEHLKFLRKLMYSCQKGSPRKKLISDCLAQKSENESITISSSK